MHAHDRTYYIYCLKYETVGCDLPALQTTGPPPPKAAVAKPAGVVVPAPPFGRRTTMKGDSDEC